MFAKIPEDSRFIYPQKRQLEKIIFYQLALLLPQKIYI